MICICRHCSATFHRRFCQSPADRRASSTAFQPQAVAQCGTGDLFSLPQRGSIEQICSKSIVPSKCMMIWRGRRRPWREHHGLIFMCVIYPVAVAVRTRSPFAPNDHSPPDLRIRCCLTRHRWRSCPGFCSVHPRCMADLRPRRVAVCPP